MGNGNSQQPLDLQKEMEKRKAWFFECQLRRLNIGTFKDITDPPDPLDEELLNFISEEFVTPTFRPNGLPGEFKKSRIYLDNGQPVWTKEVKAQRDVYAESFLGRVSNWLELVKPVKVAEKIAALKKLLEDSTYHSTEDKINDLNKLGRKDQVKDDWNLSHVLSRVRISQDKPWLIPELFQPAHADTKNFADWLHNAETFMSHYENELMQFLGKEVKPIAFDPENPANYRKEIQGLIDETLAAKSATDVVADLCVRDEMTNFYTYDQHLQTKGHEKKKLFEYPYSESVKRWGYAFNLKEIYLNLENSDMGLCLVMRGLYLYGRLPASFSNNELFTWRTRKMPNVEFERFIEAKLLAARGDRDRTLPVRMRLRILLELEAENLCAADIRYSLLSESYYKRALLGYKFWIDEEYKFRDENPSLPEKIALRMVTPPFVPLKEDKFSNMNKARKDVTGKDDYDGAEMEYWSENHYIMFASSEYLAGQLWQEDEFQPAKDFIGDSKVGILTGKQRMERARARLMKWLNNKLLFGWAEYNSSGYYREHLWALLNLVDFAMDKELRQKATIVTDLLLFDAVRFMHKGAMGACGGRSQFKSKHSGWEGGLADVLEIMFGNKGIFVDGDGQIGFAFASSTYKVPDVLLQIGHAPPLTAFIDRSRVSITFAEAGKYGIQISKQSDEHDALTEGYKEKREKHYKQVIDVNAEIARTHHDYGQKEDDTIFWWSLSAFFNKEIVRNAIHCIDKLQLQNTGVFGTFLPMLLDFLMPLVSRAVTTTAGGLLAGNFLANPIVGAAAGYFSSDLLGTELEESAADDLSIFLDGSTRTRANIYTYRDRDVMLSSIQNFRAGQLNYQTQVNQATISTEINVFITAFYGGLNLNNLMIAGTGGLLGAGIGAVIGGGGAASTVLAIGGAVAAGIANEEFVDGMNVFGKENDGPSWWTGYWALPMVVQHRNAAILAFDTHWIQRRLADYGSHAYFPKNAFDDHGDRRCGAYQNKDVFIEDLFDIGPKGFWYFGKLKHGTNLTGENEEAYIGVFSNQRPKWMDKDEDYYKAKLEKDKVTPNVDFFADREWLVDDNNIWIIHVGSSAEFTSFENFKDQLSKAKVEMDDAGDFECTYHKPDGAGNTERITLKYGDGGKFKLNDSSFLTDLYPRFENPFIRRGVAAWGQREWVIEYNGKSILHDFSNWNELVRKEDVPSDIQQLERIRALVVYIKTGDESMELYSTAKAKVHIGCETVATDEVIAVGVGQEDGYHDGEWIFFDREMSIFPDMWIEITHPKIDKTGEDEPEWSMSFELVAVLGDHALCNCSLSFGYFHFEDEDRSTGRLPFSVRRHVWRAWSFPDEKIFDQFHIVAQPGYDRAYYDYTDVFAIDRGNRLWFLRLTACTKEDGRWAEVADVLMPSIFGERPMWSISLRPGHFYLFLLINEELLLLVKENDSAALSKPMKVAIETASDTDIFGFPTELATRVNVNLDASAGMYLTSSTVFPYGADLYITGKDGNIYSVNDWFNFSSTMWRKIKVTFQLAASNSFGVWRDLLFAVDDKQQLWVGEIERSVRNLDPAWKIVGPDGIAISKFVLEASGDSCLLLVLANNGQIWAAFAQQFPLQWQRVGATNNFTVSSNAGMAAVFSSTERVDIFVTGPDSNVHQNFNVNAAGWQESWTIAERPGEIFKLTPETAIVARSRVRGQIELFSTLNRKMVKTWFS